MAVHTAEAGMLMGVAGDDVHVLDAQFVVFLMFTMQFFLVGPTQIYARSG